MKKIAVIGTGYVGLTSAAVFANAGFLVSCVDIDETKITSINRGKSFFYEQGINVLLAKAISAKRLKATTNYKEAIDGADYVFSCVGTPDKPDGSSNLSFVYAAAKEAAPLMKDQSIYIQKSTVPVGTGAKVSKILDTHKTGGTLHYVSSPEFLREGTAVLDLLNSDRVVVGNHHKAVIEAVFAVYRQVEKDRAKIAKAAGINIKSPKKTTYIGTSIESAELIKVSANAFLALKISFANSIAKLADHTNADINEVMDAVGSDWRIGRAFLNAGRGYGGGCFPKDVTGLISSATEHGVDLPIMIAAADVNGSMPGYIANKALSKLGKFSGKKMAVLGLSFKTGTSDARRSPGVKLANILDHEGATVSVYDPEANYEAKSDLRKSVQICNNAHDAVDGADAVFVSTDWPLFLKMDLSKLKNSMSGDLFVDCMNAFSKADVTSAGLQFIGVGRN